MSGVSNTYIKSHASLTLHSNQDHRYTSSNGLVSDAQLSHTPSTIDSAFFLLSFSHTGPPTSSPSFNFICSAICGRFMRERTARLRTHSCICFVNFHCPRPRTSRLKRHSPLRREARISVQAWWRRFVGEGVKRLWS